MKKSLFIICMIAATISFAKKWDAVYINKLIANGDIDKVIQHYQDGYYSENRNPQDAFKIAELYVKKKDYASAMKWYDKESQLINSSKVNLFNYANTNRLMGEYQKALDGYLMYAANTGDVAKVMDLANQVEKILKLSSLAANYKLDNYTYNTADDEINVALLRTNAVYNTVKNTSNKEDKQVSDINQVVREFQNFAEPVKAYRNNIPKLVITSLSYSKDGNTVVFAAKDEKTSSKKNTKNNEKIYIADNLGGNFLNAKPLSFNIDGFSFKNPSFNNDATAIYFSSNHTGTLGGFDIWKSTYEKGKWTTPVNLGKLINTKSDETNPFIVQDENENILYFSSDREGGFGGFDIYAAKRTGNIWQDAEMQSAPINSAGDDISIIYDNEIKTGYFSSNRTGGKGGFDVYRFTPFSLRIIINTTDSVSGKPVDYAYAQLNENGTKTFEGVTDEKGKATFQVGKDRTFRINISKDNYKPVVVNASSAGKANGDSVVVNVLMKQDEKFSVLKGATNTISMENYIIFTGHVIDAATNKPAANTKMRMLNYATQKVRELDLDKDGKFEIKLLLNNNYKVIFENSSAKLTDELTSYGLDKNDVKVRDYILSGSKLKLNENKVYKNGNLPGNMKIDTKVSPGGTFISSAVNEPITQSKIDSLKKVLSGNNPQLQKTETVQTKTVSAKKPVASIAPIAVEKTIPVPEPVKTEIVNDDVEIKKEKESQTIVVGPGDELPKVTTPIQIKTEKETTILAADIITTNKDKKVKIIKTDEEDTEENNAEIIETAKVEMPNIEKTIKDTIKEVKDKSAQALVISAATQPSKEMVKEKANHVKATDSLKSVVVELPEAAKKQTQSIKNEVAENKPSEEIENVTAKITTAKPTENKNTNPISSEKAAKTPGTTETKVVTTKNNTVQKTSDATISSEKATIKEPTKTIVESKPTETIEELPEVYFKIQLASYDAGNIQFPEFENLGKIEMTKAYDRYIYRLGNFTELERAKEVLDQVRAKGYFVAFILQYNKDKVTGIVK